MYFYGKNHKSNNDKLKGTKFIYSTYLNEASQID